MRFPVALRTQSAGPFIACLACRPAQPQQLRQIILRKRKRRIIRVRCCTDSGAGHGGHLVQHAGLLRRDVVVVKSGGNIHTERARNLSR